MKQIVDKLRDQEYVNKGSVEALRNYIRVKNPNSSGEELSAIFADALHKIIDTRIYQFEEKHRKEIKEEVLRKIIKKKEFSINAAEVFSCCLSVKLHEDSYIESFTQWINQNQPIPVSARKVDKLVSSIELLEEDYIEDKLDDIVDEFEAGWVEDEVLTVPGPEIAEASMPPIYEEVLQMASDQYSTIEDNALETGEAAACRSIGELETAETSELNFLKLLGPINKLSDLVLSNIKYVRPSVKLALPAALPLIIIAALTFADLFSDNRIHALQHQDQGKYADIAEEQVDRYLSLESKVLKKLGGFRGEKNLVLLDGLQDEHKYEEVDREKLKKWLDSKNSLLSEEPYFTAILATSKQYDIHPLLMFAIVGQEQGFVPKNGASAKKIANNPFNVYGSWEKYNTDIYDSSRLAANTIIKSSRNRPAYINTIRWINRRYAEDPNWWNGVSKLFDQMKKDMEKEK